MNALPRTAVAGGSLTDVSTRSGRVTSTVVADARQLLVSSVSTVVPVSSAQASTKYVASRVLVGTVTVIVLVAEAPAARDPTTLVPPARTSLDVLDRSTDR